MQVAGPGIDISIDINSHKSIVKVLVKSECCYITLKAGVWCLLSGKIVEFRSMSYHFAVTFEHFGEQLLYELLYAKIQITMTLN
jgi:hypothetical protein